MPAQIPESTAFSTPGENQALGLLVGEKVQVKKYFSEGIGRGGSLGMESVCGDVAVSTRCTSSRGLKQAGNIENDIHYEVLNFASGRFIPVYMCTWCWGCGF